MSKFPMDSEQIEKVYFTYRYPYKVKEFIDKLNKGEIKEDYFKQFYFYKIREYFEDKEWEIMKNALGSILYPNRKFMGKRLFLIVNERDFGEDILKFLLLRVLEHHHVLLNPYYFRWYSFDKFIRIKGESYKIATSLYAIISWYNHKFTSRELRNLSYILSDSRKIFKIPYKGYVEIEPIVKIFAFCQYIPYFPFIIPFDLLEKMVIILEKPHECFLTNEEEEKLKNELEPFFHFLLWCRWNYDPRVLLEQDIKTKEKLLLERNWKVLFEK